MFIAFVATGFTFGLLAILFLCPYMLCKGVLLLNEDDFSGATKFKAMIPIFNLFYAEKEYGRSVPVMAITSTLCAVMFITNIVMMFAMPMSVTPRLVVLFIFMLSAIITYVFSCLLVANMISVTDNIYGLKKVFYILFFPLGYYYIGNYLYKFVLLDTAKASAVEVD